MWVLCGIKDLPEFDLAGVRRFMVVGGGGRRRERNMEN